MAARPEYQRSAARPQRIIQDIRPVRAPATPSRPSRIRRRRLKRSFKLTVFLLLLLAVGISLLLFFKPWQHEQSTSVTPTPEQSVEELAAINTDEKPVVLYVTDKNKVSQPFLTGAENGDEVRLYYQAKKAVLYRPSSNEVIATSEFTPPPAKVFLRAGTTSATPMKDAEAKLKLIADINLVSKDKSATTGYASTLVIDISGRYKTRAADLAKSLGGTLSNLPKGEIAPDADILVIVGGKQEL